MPDGIKSTSLTLSNMAASRPRQRQYIAEAIAPTYALPHETAAIALFDPAARGWKSRQTQRARGAEAIKIDTSVSRPATYAVKHHATSISIPDEDRAGEVIPLNELTPWMDMLIETLSIERELELVSRIAALFTSGNSQSGAVDAVFTAPTASPLTNIRKKCETVLDASGVYPNSIAMDIKTFHALAYSEEARDAFKFTVDPATLGVDKLSAIMANRIFPNGDGRIYVSTARYNTAAEGATPTWSPIWGDDIFISYTETPRSLTATTFMTATWTGASQVSGRSGGAGFGGWTVWTMPDEKAHALFMEAGQYRDLVCPWGDDATADAATIKQAAGYRLTGANP